LFTGLIATLIVVFSVRFRRRTAAHAGSPIGDRTALEVAWTAVPLVLTLGFFVWGADLYFAQARAPEGAIDVYVVGKQWMWKFQHPDGKREINELHVPVGRPVRLTMASEDIIHSLSIPALRLKQDVLPRRYTMAWFEASRAGTYRLYCAEYCGTAHSAMIGRVILMEPREYEAWLSGGGGESLARSGERIAERLGCMSCHRPDTRDRGPSLDGLFGREVKLAGGETVIADELYVRESILNPGARIVAGYGATMPTYEGQLGEEDLLKLVAWLKSLAEEKGR
jgi:cytochrome c oxidase subunit 2